MLNPARYLDFVQKQGIDFFTGVPDSLLKNFCACVEMTLPKNNHIIAANEGGSLGLAIGHHLASGKVPMVYLQNSGLGNIVNPLLSLASEKVYSVPMVVLIGWRGEPGVKDEPQHVHQGEVTCQQLEIMDVPYEFLHKDLTDDQGEEITRKVIARARQELRPVALLVRKGTFATYDYSPKLPWHDVELEREIAVQISASHCEGNAAVVCTTGMLSRELFEYRADNKLGHQRDFLCVGGMGHASQIATGIALASSDRPVYCFDGDGAVLMHMGSLGISGTKNLGNFVHILFNNGCHESVGGQATVGSEVSFSQIASACGYRNVYSAKTEVELVSAIKSAQDNDESSFIEVIVRPGHRADIGRPTTTPKQNKDELMKFLATNGS